MAPEFAVVTTPNREYNQLFEGMAEGALRHGDHRFEWTREEFEAWAIPLAGTYGYSVTFSGIGESHPDHGAPTQMACFEKAVPS